MASSQEVVVELAQRAANGNVETTTKHTAVLRSTVTKLSRCLKCKILCSCEQTVILCMVAFSGIAHLYVFYLYSNQFTTFERDWLWIFPFLSALSLLLVLSFVVRILSAACCSQNVITKREVRPQRSLPYLLEVLRDVVKTIYLTLFDVNGKLFLVKLHLLELFENSFQMYNAVTLYTCSMPIEMMVVLSAIFIIELCIILWTSFHLDSQIYRDRQIMADMITDIFCMVFPLSYFFFAFNVPVQIETMAQLVGLPTLFLLSKANDVWEDVFKIDAQRIDANRVEIKRRSSKRNSIFQLAENIEVMQKQVNHFPNWLRAVFAICNVVFIAFYGAIIVVQLLSRPSNLQCNNIYTEDIWSKCSVELPFCQNVCWARSDNKGQALIILIIRPPPSVKGYSVWKCLTPFPFRTITHISIDFRKTLYYFYSFFNYNSLLFLYFIYQNQNYLHKTINGLVVSLRLHFYANHKIFVYLFFYFIK